MLFGLIVQLLSFAFFTIVFTLWTLRVRKRSPTVWSADEYKGWMSDWRALAGVLAINCILVLVSWPSFVYIPISPVRMS
jgi:hypothetical protein